MKYTTKPLAIPSEQLPSTWLDFLIEVERQKRLTHYTQVRHKSNWRPRIVAEGDSWFFLPLLWDLVDVLRDTYHFRMANFAEMGHTLERMVAEKEYLRAIVNEDPAALVVSGGGNDLKNELPQILLSDPPYFAPAKLVEFANQKLIPQIEELNSDVRSLPGKVPILIHGYDYGEPGKPFLIWNWGIGEALRQKEIPEFEWRTVMRSIIDQTNIMLQQLADRLPGLSFVDFRGVVGDEWMDELHPNPIGMQKLGRILSRAILEQIGN